MKLYRADILDSKENSHGLAAKNKIFVDWADNGCVRVRTTDNTKLMLFYQPVSVTLYETDLDDEEESP